MKSLKLKRLMKLENNTPVTIIYGNYRKFSGVITENDNKKSIEIKNKKDEFLIVEYRDIVSLKIKKKSSSAVTDKKTSCSDEIILPEKQVCPTEKTICENQSVPKNTDIQEQETAAEQVQDFKFLSCENYISVPQITETDIKSIYDSIPKDSKNDINKYYNSFANGVKVHEKERCIQAAENLVDYIYLDYDYEYGIDETDERIHRLCAYMMVYSGCYESAVSEFSALSDWYSAAVYAYHGGIYKQASVYASDYLEECSGDDEQNIKNMIYILVNSCLECDDFSAYASVAENRPEVFILSDDSGFMQKCMDYMKSIKNMPEERIISENRNESAAETDTGKAVPPKNDNINYGYIMNVNAGSFSGIIHSYSKKNYNFENREIMQQELKNKLKDSTKLPVEVIFESYDNNNAVSIEESDLNSSQMLERGKKYFALKKYNLAVQCYYCVLMSPVLSGYSLESEKEKAVLEISHCYMSLANISDERRNISNAISNLNKYGKYVSDIPKLCISFIDAYEKLRKNDKVLEYIEKLIASDTARPSEKLHHISKKIRIFTEKGDFEKAYDACMQWIETRENSSAEMDYADDARYREIQSSRIEPCMRKCLDEIKKSEEIQTVQPQETETVPVLQTVPEPETITENQQTVPEKIICKPEKLPEKTEIITPEPEKDLFICPDPEKSGIQPEYTDVVFSEAGSGKSKNLSPKSFISDLKKKCGKNINDEKGFLKIMHMISVMDIIDENTLKLQFMSLSPSRKSPQVIENFFKSIMNFLCENGILNRISCESLPEQQLYSVSSSGRSLISKNTVAKFVQINYKNVHGTGTINSQTVMSFGKCFEAISSFINMYASLLGKFVKYDVGIFAGGSERIFCISFNDNSFDGERRILIAAPVIAEDFSYDCFSDVENMFRNKLERKFDGDDGAVLLVISDMYGLQWAECYEKIFTGIIRKENIFICGSENNCFDTSENQVTEEYILRKAVPELPEKSDEPENPDIQTDDSANTENPDIQTDDSANTENPDIQTDDSANTENPDIQTDDSANTENPDIQTDDSGNTENSDIQTDDSGSDDEDFIETESYKSYMYDWKMTGLDFGKVIENTRNMISDRKFYCAVTYLRAASQINSEFVPFYNALSWAADSPSENHCYISGEIFSTFENQSASENEFFGYCMLAAVIRAVFYNDSEYDYSISQLYKSVCGNPLIEEIPEINSFMNIICGFRNEFHRGIDFYADYRMKGRISVETQIKEIAANADKLYEQYVDSGETTENFRIKVLRKIMFENSGKIACLLDIVRNNRRESADEAEQFLTDKIIRRNSSVTVSAIDDRRIEEYVDEMWAEAGRLMRTEYHKHTIASSDFMGSKRTNITVAVSKISKVLCEWLVLVRMSDDDNDSARIDYSRKRENLMELCSSIIDKTDELCSQKSSTGVECINNVMRDIRSRLNGSYDTKSRRYYFIDFLRNDFITLDENGIPDISSSFCLLPEFNIMERIYRHFTSEQKNFDERLSEIFSSETRYNDYGSAKFIDEYLKYIDSSFQNSSLIDDIRQYCIYSKNRADYERKDFIGDLELAQSYGQIYSPENKKETMLLMSEIWYRKSCETENFGFFTKLIENFRKLIRDDADKHGERLRNQLDDIRKIDGVSEDDINKIEDLISKQNFTVAEDHMNRIHNGEKLSDDSQELEGIEYLKEFWREYRVNYDICADSGKSLKSLVAKQRIHNKDSKARQELIDNWLSNGGSTNETQIKNLVEKLGWKNCTVKRENSQIYEVYPEKPENGRKINYKHPVAAFGSSAEQNGFRVVCIAGIYDCRRLIDKFHEIGCSNNTLVFLDCAMAEPERRMLAKEIKKDIALSKTFAVVDRVVIMYLANHYSANNIIRMLMAVTMPFSYYQPYVIDSSKVMPAEIFMGREYELNKIESPEGVNIIYGGRQLGKSALLKMARNDVDHNENGDRAVYVDIHKLGIEAAAAKISGELKINGILDTVYDNWNDLAFALKIRLVKNPSDEDYIPYLLLMLDEADTFIKDCGNHDYEPLALLKDIQSIGTDRFKFVVAGLRDIVKFDREIALGNNSVITHLSSVTIKSFTYKEARELLTLPLSYMGICFPDNEMISLILATTNYFPGLIQLYCAKLLETLRGTDYAYYTEKECPPYIVTEEHIKKVLTDQEFSSQIKEKFEITLRSDECPGEEESGCHYYLIALLISYLCYDSAECSDSGYTAEDIGKTAASFEINKISKLGTDKLVTILDELCSLNILRRTDAGKYHFKRDSFLAMMGKNKSGIENKLMEYIGK